MPVLPSLPRPCLPRPSRPVLAACLLLPALAATVGPAAAQSAASRIDQPTAGTLPPGTSTVQGGAADGDAGGGRLPPPRAIRPSTDVMRTDGTPDGARRTDPMKHLPETMR